jgi:hypothetical protein
MTIMAQFIEPILFLFVAGFLINIIFSKISNKTRKTLDNLFIEGYSKRKINKYISLHKEFHKNIQSKNISNISKQMTDIWSTLNKKDKNIITNRLKLRVVQNNLEND